MLKPCIYHTKIGETVDFDTVLKKASNYDLIGLSYTSASSYIIKTFTGSSWTHVGLVYVLNGTKYVVEIGQRLAADEPAIETKICNSDDLDHVKKKTKKKAKTVKTTKTTKKKRDITVRPLKEWILYQLEHRKNCRLVWVQYKENVGTTDETKASKLVSSFLLKYFRAKITVNLLNWKQTLYSKRLKISKKFKEEQLSEHQGKFFCSDFVALLLQYCRVLNNDIKEPVYQSTLYTPGELIFDYPSIYNGPLLITV